MYDFLHNSVDCDILDAIERETKHCTGYSTRSRKVGKAPHLEILFSIK